MTVAIIQRSDPKGWFEIPQEPQKPRSLSVHEIAIPVLKRLGQFLEFTAECALGFILEGAIVQDLPTVTIALVVGIVAGVFCLLVEWAGKSLKMDLENLNGPEWSVYFSEAFRNRSIEELMEALPYRRAWKKLNWNGLEWKQKILPYAEAHQLSRKDLEEQFPSIFPFFNPYLHDYYRKRELPLLQTQGFHAYLIAAGQMGPKSVRDEELRTQLIQETAGLSQEQIQDQYPAEYTALLRT